MTLATYLPRSAWGARPRNGGGRALVASRVEGTALHWPGMAKPIDAAGADGMRRVASALRGWQDYHMNVRKWSDIAYQVAVDQVGRVWTLRGLNTQSGANGNEDVNERFGAILLVLGPGEAPSAAMKASVRAVVGDFHAMFPLSSTKPKGHRDVRPAGTDCPGPLAYAAIGRGEFTYTKAVPKPEDDDVAEITPTQMSELRRMMAEESDKAGRRWALYVVLYGLETVDDLEAAREEWRQAYAAAIKAGKTEEQAEADGSVAAERQLATLRAGVKQAQANA